MDYIATISPLAFDLPDCLRPSPLASAPRPPTYLFGWHITETQKECLLEIADQRQLNAYEQDHFSPIKTLEHLTAMVIRKYLPSRVHVRAHVNQVYGPKESRCLMLAICDNYCLRDMATPKQIRGIQKELGFYRKPKRYADRGECHWCDPVHW